MSIDDTIFGLRFGTTPEISPSQEELDAFLRSPKKIGRKELHGHDTATYAELLRRIRAIEKRAGAKQDLREKMFCFALRHSCFVNLALKSAVEHYKYHAHALTTLDFKKPKAFIMSAEAEMRRLKRREDGARVERLRFMVEERRKALKVLERRRDALIRELLLIARYVRDNLVKVEKLCETSIVVLVNAGVGRGEEVGMIEEMRARLKENLSDYQSDGPAPRHDPEALNDDIEQLSNEVSRLFREDVYALASLYEAVHDHAHKTAAAIDALLAQTKDTKDKGGGDETRIYVRLEGVLVSLVSDFHFELKPAASPAGPNRIELVRETRNEMLGRLFELLQRERRQRVDRRKFVDRRKSRDPNYQGPERRGGRERRSGKSRRKT
ncbi:MAG: hypothetical protein ACM32I_01845 [Nitrospirota bacterium]